jgi:hypothetical protein
MNYENNFEYKLNALLSILIVVNSITRTRNSLVDLIFAILFMKCLFKVIFIIENKLIETVDKTNVLFYICFILIIKFLFLISKYYSNKLLSKFFIKEKVLN